MVKSIDMNVDLNKILARQDYVKLTKSLRKKCDHIENVICDKMDELELCGTACGIVVNDMRIFCVKGYLFIRTPEKDDDRDCIAEYRQVSSNDNDIQSIVNYDDGRAFRFYPCGNKHALRFLNNAVAIIEKLGEIEQEKVDNIEKALESAKNI